MRATQQHGDIGIAVRVVGAPRAAATENRPGRAVVDSDQPEKTAHGALGVMVNAGHVNALGQT